MPVTDLPTDKKMCVHTPEKRRERTNEKNEHKTDISDGARPNVWTARAMV